MIIQSDLTSLSGILGGTLAYGTIPLKRIAPEVCIRGNAGIVSIPGAGVQVCATPAFALVQHDMVFLWAALSGTMGGVAGTVTLTLRQNSGTGTTTLYGSQTETRLRKNPVAISELVYLHMCGAFICTAPGDATYGFELYGITTGSALAVPAEGATLWACPMHKGGA